MKSSSFFEKYKRKKLKLHKQKIKQNHSQLKKREKKLSIILFKKIPYYTKYYITY